MEDITIMNNKSSTLCFKKEDFVADDFSVDKFVSECRKNTSLETMREELGLFLRVLQSAMVELINKDYADFVNLSTNLVGLDKSIKSLSIPLGQLKEEIMCVKQRLDEDLSIAQKIVSEREDIHKKKIQIHRMMCILEGIENIQKQNLVPLSEEDEKNKRLSYSGEVMERIAIEFNQVLFHISKSNNYAVVQEKKAVVSKISDVLRQHLEVMLIQSVSSSDEDNLCKVLQIYSSMDKIEEVENKFRIHVVRPYMRQVITEEYITKEGIDNMYNCILDFVSSKCAVLLEVTRRAKRGFESLKGYDFLANAVWPEIVLCIDYIAPVVFAPGNPSLFHKNYCATMKFVSNFESSCVVLTSVKRLREHLAYKTFMEKWNVHVYFHLRFQEIAGLFEMALTSPFSTPDIKTSFLLNCTSALWTSLNLCWDDNVYLSPLCHSFWKLTLQLLSRFLHWINSTTEASCKIYATADNSEENSVTTGSQDFEITDDSTIIQFVKLVRDIECLVVKVQHFFKEKIYIKEEIQQLPEQQAEEALMETIRTLYDIPSKLGLIIVKQLTVQCSQHLKLITDIPRLYRKTNRDVPSKPSSYVTVVFNPLVAFLSKAESLISQELKLLWTQEVIENVTLQCYTMTADVITSIKKMEDSLKRLKKAREKSIGQVASGTISDDDKIRRQLAIDVETLGQQIEDLGVKRPSLKHYEQLLELVKSAAKASNVIGT